MLEGVSVWLIVVDVDSITKTCIKLHDNVHADTSIWYEQQALGSSSDYSEIWKDTPASASSLLKMLLACLQEVCLHPLVAMHHDGTVLLAALSQLSQRQAVMLLRYLLQWMQHHTGKL